MGQDSLSPTGELDGFLSWDRDQRGPGFPPGIGIRVGQDSLSPIGKLGILSLFSINLYSQHSFGADFSFMEWKFQQLMLVGSSKSNQNLRDEIPSILDLSCPVFWVFLTLLEFNI